MTPEKIYVDGFQLAFSAHDARIFFMSSEPIFTDGVISGADTSVASKVVMTVPLAKQLCEQLSIALANYESQFGKIIDLQQSSTGSDPVA